MARSSWIPESYTVHARLSIFPCLGLSQMPELFTKASHLSLMLCCTIHLCVHILSLAFLNFGHNALQWSLKLSPSLLPPELYFCQHLPPAGVTRQSASAQNASLRCLEIGAPFKCQTQNLHFSEVSPEQPYINRSFTRFWTPSQPPK